MGPGSGDLKHGELGCEGGFGVGHGPRCRLEGHVNRALVF